MDNMEIENGLIDIPRHLNADFFKNIIEKNFLNHNIPINIKSLTFKRGSFPGENYCSEIYCARLSFDTNDSIENFRNNFIIKYTKYAENGEPKFVERMELYKKEQTMYFDVFPVIEKLLGNVQIGPKCYWASSEPHQTLVLDDLSLRGYKTACRERGFDEIHAKLCMQKLGKFHAASMILAERKPKLMKTFYHGLFGKHCIDEPIYTSIIAGNLGHFIEIAEQWPNYENIITKLRRLHGNFAQIILEHVAPKEDELKVLNHGDFWVNNILFKYEDENNKFPEDLMFVDYQMSFYTSPGIDINYILNTSLQLEILQVKRDELIDEYYKSLVSTLKDLNYGQIPTEQLIRQEIHAKEFYGFISAVCIAPIIMMERSSCQDNSMEVLADETSAKQKRKVMFGSRRYEEFMKYSLKRFDELGIFD